MLAVAFGAKGFARAQGGASLTLTEIRTLAASDGSANANFGHAVSISGNFAAVSAWGAQLGKGAVYLYAQNQGGADQWQQVRKITVADGQAGDQFGYSVSLSGDTLAVGAPQNDEYGLEAGMVYVFERNLGGADQWGLLCKVATTHLSAGDRFGYSVSLDLNLLAVGAYNDNSGGSGIVGGAAFVFHRNYGTGWFGEVARLVASDAATGDRFGMAVALSGDRVVVGAPFDDYEQSVNVGSAYVFARDHGGYNQWGQVRVLRGETSQDLFGQAVAIHGPLVLVGAPESNAGGSQTLGRAYLYERNQNGADAWGLVKTLNPAGATTGMPRFGCAVALDAHRALVGAWNDTQGNAEVGAVHVYARDAGGLGYWGQIQRLVGQEAADEDLFGAAVALDGDTALVGMDGDDPQGESSGTARLFTWSGNRWYFEQKLLHTNPELASAEDRFGSSVSLEGGRLAAGAFPFHPLGWTGKSSALVYERHPASQAQPWSLQQELNGYLEYDIDDDLGFTSISADGFGAAVALDAEQLVVGSPRDHAENRGTARFFERNEGGSAAWGQVGKSNQHTRHDWENVGRYLAVEGFAAVLGSEASSSEGDGGNAYLYCRDAGGLSGPWNYLRRFEVWAENGVVVALGGNFLAIGIPVENLVHVHARNQGGKDQWGRVATLRSPAFSYVGDFGGRLAISGDTLAVGPLTFPDVVGSVFIFQRNAGGADQWGLVTEVLPEDSRLGSNFGADLALDGDTLVVSAPLREDGRGAVYVFRRNKGWADHWGQVARITAPDARPNSAFGSCVSISGGFLAVGAPEDDEHDYNSGAVYTFVRRDNLAPTMGAISGPDFTRSPEDAPLDSIVTARAGSVVALAQASDADNDLCGMAVIGVEGAGGKWQYSGDGEHWTDFSGVSSSLARLLGPDARIRFVPDANFHGTVRPGLTFRAWDQTSGLASSVGNAQQFGGATPFSEQTETWGWEVSPVNDRPALDESDSPRLPDIYGNILSQYNRGQSVSNLVQGQITDIDGDTCGIGVISVVETSGVWQYSTDNGSTWRPLTGVRYNNARLLGPAARVRFVPEPNFSGSVSNGFHFVAWDQTSGDNGGLANTQVGTAFSTFSDAASILVTPVVNHAPELDLFGSPALLTIPRNATENAGTPVAHLLQDWVEDFDGDACGIALAQVDTTVGTWEFSLNDGVNWSSVGTVSFTSSLLLGPEARLRLVPSVNYTGTVVAAVQYRAWDQTSGSEGSKVNTSNNGGNTAFSIGIEPAPITVSSAANHAPIMASPPLVYLTSIQEGEVDSAGDRVGDLLGSLVTDADGNLCGMAVYGQDTNYGTWAYYSAKGLAWLPLGTVSSAAARLLAPDTRVRFVPASRYSGTVSNGLSFRAWDRSAGLNGGTGNLTPNGGSTPYSTRTGTARITVTDVNHAPVLSSSGTPALGPVLENSGINPGTLVTNLIQGLVTDADRDVCGIAVLDLNTDHGVWQYWNEAGLGRWVRLDPPMAPYARLFGPGARLRFVPDTDYRGTVTNALQFRAWDQTRGTNFGETLIVQTGGQMPYSSVARWASQGVNEANRAPTDLVLDNDRVFENRPVGFVLGRFSVTDPNAADTHTFSLVAGEGSDDNASFTIETNALKMAAILDRETQATYSIRVQARDAGGLTLQKVFVVALDDLHDTAPTDLILNPAAVTENEPVGTLAGQFAVVDPDLGETHSFALVTGEGDADNSAFVVESHTLKTTAVFDFETKRTYQVRVQANDGHGGTFAKALIVEVRDVAENTPPKDLTMSCTCLLPGSPADTTVGILRFIDPNPGDRHNVSLVAGPGDADNAKFKFQARALLTTGPLDFDVQSKYQVRIQVEDAAGEIAQKAFEIVPAVPIWQEDFESGVGLWTHAAEAGQDTWQFSTAAAHSPSQSLGAAGTTNPSDASAVSPWIEIPVQATQVRLEFHHQYNWGAHPTNRLDVGVLECRRQGEAWQDVWAGELDNFFLAGAYRGAMSATNVHPLSARPVWSGNTSNSFVSAALALNAGQLAGQSVQFRWRQVSTSGLVSPRWHLDDVRLGVVTSAINTASFRVVSCVLRGTQLDLTWESMPTQAYTIESNPVPGGGVWTPVGAATLGASGATVTTVTLDLTQLPGYPHKELYFRIKSQ